MHLEWRVEGRDGDNDCVKRDLMGPEGSGGREMGEWRRVVEIVEGKKIEDQYRCQPHPGLQ